MRLEDEVVVVAGSGGGLGRLLVEVYAIRGVRAVVGLDVRVPGEGAEREEWEERGVRWFRCDVRRREEVERVREEIVKEVCHRLVSNQCSGVWTTIQGLI